QVGAALATYPPGSHLGPARSHEHDPSPRHDSGHRQSDEQSAMNSSAIGHRPDRTLGPRPAVGPRPRPARRSGRHRPLRHGTSPPSTLAATLSTPSPAAGGPGRGAEDGDPSPTGGAVSESGDGRE